MTTKYCKLTFSQFLVKFHIKYLVKFLGQMQTKTFIIIKKLNSMYSCYSEKCMCIWIFITIGKTPAATIAQRQNYIKINLWFHF